MYADPRTMLHLFVWYTAGFVIKDSVAAFDTKGPVFNYEPPNQVDFSNMTGARIECTAHGNPQPSVQWLRADGTQVVEIPSLITVLENGTLVFRPFRAEDYRQDIHAVVYKCAATNAIGTIVSRDVKVRGVVKQFYEVQVYDEFVIKGNIAVLKCHVPSFVRDHVLVAAWMRDDAIITHSSTGRITISSTGEMYIRDAGAKDSLKNYRCKTVHRLTGDVRQSSPGRLIITDPQSSVPPRLTHSVTSIQVRQGDVAELPCTAQGYPVPSYKWYKVRGKQATSLDSIQQVSQQHNLLLIQNVQLEDAGTYMCVINNTVGEEKVETNLLVTASLSAYIQPQQQVIDADKPAEMSCIVSGHPVSTISWSKNGRPIDIDGPFVFPKRDVLQITSIRRADRGMYQCFVENDEESVQATAEIRLGDASPAFHSTFQEEIIEAGTPVSLHCAASGNPTAEISWTLDGSSIPVNRRFHIGAFVSVSSDVISYINISTSRVEDGGEYSCTAVNDLGKATHSARLNVRGLPYIRQMANQTIVAGTDFHIRCPASGYPIHSITWEKEGSLLPAALHQTVYANGTLVVNKVQRTDAGTYTCIAKNNKGLTARKTLWVSVLDPPKIEPFSFPRDVREGMRARVFCSVIEGDSPVSILWTKGDEALPTDSDTTVQSTDEFSSLLMFKKVSAKHNGNYTCIVSNAAAVVQHTAELLVHVPPHWLAEPNDVSVLLSHRVELACRADGYPQPNITWLRGEGRLPGDYRNIHHFGSHLLLSDNGSLIIDKVKKKDDGYYLCQATNGIGSGLSKVVYLTINVPAYFEVKHRNQTAKKGDQVQLQCEAWGDAPLRMRWNRNDSRIEYEDDQRFITTTHQRENSILAELSLKSATKSDSALFTCFATNAFGHDEASIQLFIEEKPLAPTNVQVASSTSRTAALVWTPSGDGNSQILRHVVQIKKISDDWDEKTTTNITVESGSPKGTVFHLLPGVTYNLRVIAENRLGRSLPSEHIEMTTNEEVPSGPPLAVEAKATGSESLKIMWKPPKMELWNGEILGYYTGYKVYESPEPYQYQTVEAHSNSDNVELHLTNLRKFTKYSVLVQAFNRMGRGPHSDEVVALTSEDVPSEPPQDVQCVTHTSQSLHVSWSQPSSHAQNGVIRGYKVFYRPIFEMEDDVEFHTTTTTALKTNLHSLDKYTNYSIRVLAYTRMGDGIRSDPVHCRTLEDVPGAPADIKSLTMSSDSILVAWRPPVNKNGNIIKYTLYIRGTDNGKQHTTKHFLSSAPHLSHEARGLTENRNYDFWVTASTVIGEGESTRVVTQSPKSKVMARIATFAERIVSKWKQDIFLPCRAVGLPTPTKKWKMEDKIQKLDRFATTEDGSLLIKEVLSVDSSNYTCEVENIYGRDQITYQLVIQAPPTAPVLTLLQATESSIRLKINISNTTENKIKGFTLSYKKEYGEWEEIEIEPHEDSVLLENLYCGTKYHLYLTAYNKVGAGEPSSILIISTLGAAPMEPKAEEVVVPNSTWLALNLHQWPDGGCPILYFVIKYKPASKEDWVLVSNNVQPHQQHILISELQPGAAYHMQVTAHNDAGSTVANFGTKTLTLEGEMAADAVSHDLPFFYDWSIISIIIVSALVIATAFLFAIYFFVRKRKYRGYRHSYPVIEGKLATEQQHTKTVLENGTNIVEMTYNPSARKYSLPGTRTLTSTDYNTIPRDGYPESINPYATFNVPGCQAALMQDVQRPTAIPSAMDEAERNYSQQLHPATNKSPFDLYSRVVKRIDNANPEETTQRNVTTAKYYTPTEGNPSTLVKSSGPEYYSENGKYDHPYQTWEGRRHPTEYDSVLSDTDNSDLGGSYFSESTVQLHGRGRVPDLIYHTTDSSTSNESSPDEERRPARSKKSDYVRNKIGNNQTSRDALYNSENRAEHMGQLKETTFTLQPKQPHAFNYSAPHMFPQREFDNIVHYPNNSTHLMNLHNHRRQDESAPELSSEKLHQTKKSSDCGEDYTIRV